MRATCLVLFAGTALVAATAVAQEPQRPAAGDMKAKASYSLGYRIGSSFKKQGLPLDAQSVIKGLQDGIAGAKPPISEKEMEEILQAFQQQVATQLPEKNKKEGDAFLAANAKKQGVKTTKSGLQYKVVKDGTGPVPKPTDTVKTHYRGTLLDGSQFDSSYDRGEPATFPVNKVIPGWTEALQLMKVGSKWQLFIPAELAYGPRGYPPDIGPNSTLVFDIELLGIE
ncbi:MAG: FKBP-type peptidyl-prolyl cis-trans isomerase [Planctomycetia bacterium]|nr:FKBP-type peptidyl-prolyl cis-trans isomerase [Planctomycetia bacterium]